jgi:putative flippase GtrA
MNRLRRACRSRLQSFLTRPWAETWAYLGSKDAPGLIQFGKYALCGLAADLTHNTITFALSKTWLPAFHGLPQAELAANHIYANIVGLAISNVVAYLTNVRWVFTRGRHRRGTEFVLFTAINVVSGGAGLLVGPFLRAHTSMNWWIAQGALVITCVLVNFVCRKYVVFIK